MSPTAVYHSDRLENNYCHCNTVTHIICLQKTERMLPRKVFLGAEKYFRMHEPEGPCSSLSSRSITPVAQK